MIMTREWIFRVSCKVDPGEKVFVTGSCEELGSWNALSLKPLEPVDPLDLYKNDNEIIWQASIRLPDTEIKYRYCICCSFKKDKNSDEVLYSVRRWETYIHPRLIIENVSNTSDPTTNVFGYISDFPRVDEGWLNNGCLVQLKLFKSTLHNDPIVLWKRKYKERNCFVKVTPIDLTSRKSGDLQEESSEIELSEIRMRSKSSWPNVEVSVLKENMTEFRCQDQFGVKCTDEDFVSFQCRMYDHSNIAFLVDFYIETSPEENPQYIGCSHILPINLKENAGVATLPITSEKHFPIGQFTVHYLVVHPLSGYECNLEVSFARHWKECWKGLEVGHRGAGNSFHSQTKNCSNIRENTIASLKCASDNGADMVEFDVQLSKDLIPVIYHDFYAGIDLKHKKLPDKSDLLEIPIKDLTLEQLHTLKIYHKTEKGFSRFSDEEFEDHQPFPTLEQALLSVPLSCGFNIEIKWTMKLQDGTYELNHPFELNIFIDEILKVVLKNGTSRKIIFSSFHPDICTIIRLKQNRLPVLFLTCGKSKRWPTYDDICTSSIRHAVLYASSVDILGINVHSDDLLNDSTQIQLAFDHNLVAFCWGDKNADRETIEFLKKLGLHGIIYDKINVYNTKKDDKRSLFFCEDEQTCKCIPSLSLKSRVKTEATSSLLKDISVKDITKTSLSKRSSAEKLLPVDSLEKKVGLGNEPAVKRLKSDVESSDLHSHSLTPLSFQGILSQNVIPS